MTTEPQPTQPAPSQPRRFFGLALKTFVGCGAFAFGALVVLVLLLPTLLSGTVAARASDAFARLHAGRLEVGSLSLKWFGRQRVEDARLLDPDGAEVARATVELPGIVDLLSALDGPVGTVTIAARADLSADDAGVTNLARALAPRRAAAPKDGNEAPGEGPTFDLASYWERLDLDLSIDLERVTWSDASTRAAGRPFEVQGARVLLRAQPGAPAKLHVEGRLAGDVPGSLSIDATVHGPVDPSARWPLGRTQATGRIEGFSTALVDALAGLSGDLVAVVGPTFALRFDIAAESAERADVDLTIDGARAGLGFAARLADGEIASGEKPLLVATLPFPRTILERVLAPHLPPDARLDLADAGRSWTIRVPRARVPLPEAGGADLASLRPALERAEIDLEADLPGTFRLQTDALRAAQLAPSASGLAITARAVPGQPLVASLDLALEAGAPGRVEVHATIPQAFAQLAGAPLAPADLDVRATGLSTLFLGELAGQGERLATALGPTARVSIEARGVNLLGGTLRAQIASERLELAAAARVADGVLSVDAAEPVRLTWTPAPEFVAAEVAPHLPAGAELALDGPLAIEVGPLAAPLVDAGTGGFAGVDALLSGLAGRVRATLPDARWTSDATRAAGVATALRSATIEADLVAAAPPRVRLAALLDAGGAARLAVDAQPRATLVQLASGGSRALAAEVSVTGLDTAALERLAGLSDRIVPALGPALALVAKVDGDPASDAAFDVVLEGARGRVAAAGRVAGGRVDLDAARGLDARVTVSPELLASLTRDALPAGATLALGSAEPAALVVVLRDVSTPLDGADAWARLATTRASLDVELPGLVYADARTTAAGRPVALDGMRLSARLAPTEAPTVRFTARVLGTPTGEIEVDVAAHDELAKLAEPDGWRAFRGAVRVKSANVPTALVDALAGQDGLLVEALGPAFGASVDAPDVSFARGTFEARFAGGDNQVTLSGRLEDGALVVERADGLDARVAVGPLIVDRVVGGLLPLVRKASFAFAVERSDLAQSAALAPFVVKSDALRFDLSGDLSKLDGVVQVDLGTLSFRGLPMLDQLGLALDAGDVRLPAFSVPIEKGVATYRGLPIRVGGRDLLFDGTVRLVDGEMALTTSVPLAILGKKFERELAKVRDFVPADTAVPLEIRGTWKSPRVGLRDGFLQGLLEKAAGKAVEDGLDGLLDGLLGGKKKKKDG